MFLREIWVGDVKLMTCRESHPAARSRAPIFLSALMARARLSMAGMMMVKSLNPFGMPLFPPPLPSSLLPTCHDLSLMHATLSLPLFSFPFLSLPKIRLSYLVPTSLWRERRDSDLRKRDAIAAEKKAQRIKDAQQYIDDFYDNYNSKKDKTTTKTRKDAEDFLAKREDTSAGGTSWERIGKLVDLSGKGAKGMFLFYFCVILLFETSLTY